MRIYSKVLIVTIFFFSVGLSAQEKIEFPSKDGLIITADLYEVENPTMVILLCHQAGYS